MSEDLFPDLTEAAFETLHMTALTTLWALLFGIPLGVLLYATGKQGVTPLPWAHRILSTVVNIGRSAPFVVVMVAVVPLTRAVTGTTIGAAAAIVPLSLAAIPFFARLVESALLEVDPGLLEAAASMGAGRVGTVGRVLLPEATPGLIRALTVTIVAVVSYSAMAGAIGGGGLGDLAISYGYHRFQTDYMVGAVLALVILVQAMQLLGDAAARRLDRR